jgi:hypothetical protein
VKRYGNYGRKASRIVKRFGKYGKKASWRVKWHGIYGSSRPPPVAAAAAAPSSAAAAAAAAATIALKFRSKHITNKNKTKHIMKISHINVNIYDKTATSQQNSD